MEKSKISVPTLYKQSTNYNQRTKSKLGRTTAQKRSARKHANYQTKYKTTNRDKNTPQELTAVMARATMGNKKTLTHAATNRLTQRQTLLTKQKYARTQRP